MGAAPGGSPSPRRPPRRGPAAVPVATRSRTRPRHPLRQAEASQRLARGGPTHHIRRSHRRGHDARTRGGIARAPTRGSARIWLPLISCSPARRTASLGPSFFSAALAVARPMPPRLRRRWPRRRRRPGRQPRGVVRGSSGTAIAGVSPTWPGSSSSAGGIRSTEVRPAPRRRVIGAAGVAIAEVTTGVVLATALLAGYGPVVDRWAPSSPRSSAAVRVLSVVIATSLMHLAPTVAGSHPAARVCHRRDRGVAGRSAGRCARVRARVRRRRAARCVHRTRRRPGARRARPRRPARAGDVDDRSALAPDGGLEHHRRPAVVHRRRRHRGRTDPPARLGTGRLVDRSPGRAARARLARPGAGRVVDAPRPRSGLIAARHAAQRRPRLRRWATAAAPAQRMLVWLAN